jgi:hypothetical protein
VLWFVNVNYPDPREESEQPVLRRYLAEPSFSQNLLARQPEVDSALRDIVVPAILNEDQWLRKELDKPVPLERVIKLREVRSLIDFGPAWGPHSPPADLSLFERAIDLAARTTAGWGGKLIVVILPNYALSMGQGATVSRYDGVMNALDASALQFVDGAALFAAQPDVASLYTLRIENHPSEKGHALLAATILEVIAREEPK